MTACIYAGDEFGFSGIAMGILDIEICIRKVTKRQIYIYPRDQ